MVSLMPHDPKGVSNFHRLVDLHINCGGEVLRKYFEMSVDKAGMTLKEFLENADTCKQIPWHILNPTQKQTLQSKTPQYNTLDVTILSKLIINTCDPQIDNVEEDIKQLRLGRNGIVHIVKGEVLGNTEFNKTSQHILKIAACVSETFKKTIMLQMNEIRSNEMVRTCRNMDKIMLNGEELMMKLVQTNDSEKVDADADVTWNKYNMIKWIRQLSRLKSINLLMKGLKDDGVISDTEKRAMEQESVGDVMQLLVLHLQNETKENISKFCTCLRQLDPNLADLVENKNTDGKDTESYLTSLESTCIRRVLRENLVESQNQSVSCENIHIYVEENLGSRFSFESIKAGFVQEFPDIAINEGDTTFNEITWKNTITQEDVQQTNISLDPCPNFREMSCEKFASYVGDRVEWEVKRKVKEYIENAFKEECITPSLFVTIDEHDLEKIVTPYLRSIKYGYGIQKALSHLQKNINDNMLPTSEAHQSCSSGVILRPFDRPTPSEFAYKKGTFRPLNGNLLTPVHEFRLKDEMTYSFISREVVRFIAACMNGRKNGTIHFGMTECSNGRAQIIGIPQDKLLHKKLHDEIEHCIERCFRSQELRFALHCTRPIQIIPIEASNNIIIELDVIPSSSFSTDKLAPILFPPKGPQSELFVIYDQKPKCEMLPIDRRNVEDVQKAYNCVYQERVNLEQEKANDAKEDDTLHKKLANGLTGNRNRYVTDEFVPIIVSGNLSGCPDEDEIRKQLNMEFAFTSAKIVLDFDASTKLRKQVEKDKVVYSVKTAEDFLAVGKSPDISGSTWIYCNGNEDVSLKRHKLMEWVKTRHDGVKRALRLIRETIPRCRARVIFLIYDKRTKGEKDPLFEIAREALVAEFRDECIFIAHRPEDLSRLRTAVKDLVATEIIDQNVFTGLGWHIVSEVMTSVFRSNPNVVCILPRSNGGHLVEMTVKEKDYLKLDDLNILSGEQCEREAEEMKKDDRRKHEQEMEKKFYKGGQAADWWNFYYPNQVGERNDFAFHRDEIQYKLRGSRKGEALIEVHTIEHHPGAGGSTLGRHLLWHFSQFSKSPDAYRCCLVNSITDKTVEQIERFRAFKDKSIQKPFVVLLDNETEDGVMLLRSKLHEAAYKTACPGKLFCLLILVNRVSISSDKASSKENRLLTHRLKGKEIQWFEKKYTELEEKETVDVDTLIAFNVMRKSFDKEYIADLVTKFMSEVTRKEEEVLTCLSLINSYDSDHPIPQSVFDKLMGDQIELATLSMPYGIAHSIKELEKMQEKACLGKHCLWSVNMSNAMALLVTKREDTDLFSSGICVISQPLAKAILHFIMEKWTWSLDMIVNTVLDLVADHKKETNPMSKEFVRIACSLFKTRQVEETDRGETKLKFSDLVLELGRQDVPNSDNLVLTLMKRCFEISEDAMVGQQLARFNIHIKDFDAAEIAIKESLHYKPENSYLLDTYGQIFKSKMEYLFECKSKVEKLNTREAAEGAQLAFSAIEKFKAGQEIAKKCDEGTNMSCFQAEVKTALTLLEKCERFECYGDRKSFLQFLNDPDYHINGSPYLELMHECPDVKQIRAGSQWQKHLEVSLRSLEEVSYQIKKHLYTVYTEDEALLLKIRERFERFYGEKETTGRYQFRFGLGLKPLMAAATSSDKSKNLLKQRVKDAENNLIQRPLAQADMRDLLVFVGNSIIQLSGQSSSSEKVICSNDQYRQLLTYSTRLIDIQRQMVSTMPQRMYLESFLYHAMLHWPLKSRTAMEIESLCRGYTYQDLIREWDEAYNKNHYINTPEQNRMKKPKNYFALGKGTPGNDIVDLESIKKEWVNRKKESEGRCRRPVFADNFWKEDFVQERLERLVGTVGGDGHVIVHEVEYSKGKLHTFKVKTYYPCDDFSNRQVTFVLGFTWKGPTAFDVRDKESEKVCSPRIMDTNPWDDLKPKNGAHDNTVTDEPPTDAPTSTLHHPPTNSNGQGNKRIQTGATGGPDDIKF